MAVYDINVDDINKGDLLELANKRDFWKNILEKMCRKDLEFNKKYSKNLNLILNPLIAFFRTGNILEQNVDIIKKIFSSDYFIKIFEDETKPDVIDRIGGLSVITSLFVETNRKRVQEILGENKKVEIEVDPKENEKRIKEARIKERLDKLCISEQEFYQIVRNGYFNPRNNRLYKHHTEFEILHTWIDVDEEGNLFALYKDSTNHTLRKVIIKSFEGKFLLEIYQKNDNQKEFIKQYDIKINTELN